MTVWIYEHIFRLTEKVCDWRNNEIQSIRSDQVGDLFQLYLLVASTKHFFSRLHVCYNIVTQWLRLPVCKQVFSWIDYSLLSVCEGEKYYGSFISLYKLTAYIVCSQQFSFMVRLLPLIPMHSSRSILPLLPLLQRRFRQKAISVP